MMDPRTPLPCTCNLKCWSRSQRCHRNIVADHLEIELVAELLPSWHTTFRLVQYGPIAVIAGLLEDEILAHLCERLLQW